MFEQKIIDLLKENCFGIEKVANARIAAALVYKGLVVSIGTNQKKSHPFQAKFSKNSDSIFLHAETDCIIRSLRLLSLEEISRSTLYVCRIKQTNDGTVHFGLAKPCLGCARAISSFNINRCIYTTDTGFACL